MKGVSGKPSSRAAAVPHLEAFLEMLSAERGASVNTLAAYERDVRDCAGFLREAGVADASRASSEDLRAYMEACWRRSLAPATLARRLASLRAFYRFLLLEGIRADNPCRSLAGGRSPKPLPRILSVEETSRLLAAAAMSHSVSGQDDSPLAAWRRTRLECMMEILYGAGLRVSELVSLPVAAVLSGERRQLKIRGKGGRERMVLLHARAVESLERWLEAREEHARGSASRWLFPGGRGGGGGGGGGDKHITRHRFTQLLKELALRAGLDARRVSPHVLRHAFASHLLENGADLRSIQHMLGHADIATTQIYTHVLEEQTRALVLAAHPLARAAEGARSR